MGWALFPSPLACGRRWRGAPDGGDVSACTSASQYAETYPSPKVSSCPLPVQPSPARGEGTAIGILLLVHSSKNLETPDRDLDQDQNDDGNLEPQRALGVDDVGQRIGGFGDHRELALERI